MKEGIPKTFGVARNIHLLPEEKREGWNYIVSRTGIGLKKRRSAEMKRHSETLFEFFQAWLLRGFQLAFSLFLVVLIGGMAQAQAALPGDFLYPMKTMGEQIVSTFTFSPTGRAHWETIRTAHRLEEAERLEENHTATPAVRAQLEKEIATQLQKATGRIDELATQGQMSEAVEIGTLLQSTLMEHQKVMERVTEPQGMTSLSPAQASSSGSSSLDATAVDAFVQEGTGAVLVETGTGTGLNFVTPLVGKEEANQALQNAADVVASASSLLRTRGESLSAEDRQRLIARDERAHRALENARQLFHDGSYSNAETASHRAGDEAHSLLLELNQPSSFLLDAGFHALIGEASSSSVAFGSGVSVQPVEATASGSVSSDS